MVRLPVEGMTLTIPLELTRQRLTFLVPPGSLRARIQPRAAADPARRGRFWYHQGFTRLAGPLSFVVRRLMSYRGFRMAWRCALGLLLVASVVGCSDRARPVSGKPPTREQELAALIKALKSRGVDLRRVKTDSNVIEYMFSVGPGPESENQIGLNYWPGPHRPDESVTNYAIAIPYEVHGDWVMWRVGGSRGNASEEFNGRWERVRSAIDLSSTAGLGPD
jgi:hypothetical protein